MIIDGVEIDEVLPVTLSFDRIQVEFAASTAEEREFLSRFDRTGDFKKEVGYLGEFETVDRSGRQEAFTIVPRDEHRPVIDEGEYYVVNFTEREMGSGVYDITITFQRKRNRRPTDVEPDVLVIPEGETHTVESGESESYERIVLHGTLIQETGSNLTAND